MALHQPIPSIIAHRGASFDAPENTLAAFRLGWQQRADGIEGDFHRTRDGQLVCMHDATTKRTCGIDRRIADLTLTEMRTLDAGAWKSSAYAGEHPPTLAELLAAMPADATLFMIELKSGVEGVDELHRVVRASNVDIDRLRLIAFDAEVIAASKREFPELQAYWLTGFRVTGETIEPSHDAIIDTLRRIDADGLDAQANRRALTPALVQRLRDAGLSFHVWTVDDVETARAMCELGVDSITTNRPGWMRERLSL
jgi:glycerophosphoryl diester phosphodiesterase